MVEFSLHVLPLLRKKIVRALPVRRTCGAVVLHPDDGRRLP
jgi:hypothetical protein